MQRTEASPRMIRLVTALLLLATFAAGTVTGAAVVRWAAPGAIAGSRQHGFRGPYPLGELGLTDEQAKKVRGVLERHRPALDAILKQTYPQVRQVHEKMDREIRELLTPEQQKRFDAFRARRPAGPLPGHPPGLSAGPPPGPPQGFDTPREDRAPFD